MTRLRHRGVSRSVSALALCVVVLAVATLAAAVESAQACSCRSVDSETALARANGAFVGRLVSRKQLPGFTVLIFSVERRLKGPLGRTVEVLTAQGGSSCGIDVPLGRRVGLVLDYQGDGWHANLCGQFAPADLIAATAPLPPPNGDGPAALFVSGGFGPARLLALDGEGRTLAYGMGIGTSDLSVCPGGRRVAELAYLQPGTEIVIRDARTLRQIRRQALRLRGRYPVELLCKNRDGSTVIVFATGPGDAGFHSALYRVTSERLTALWKGTAFLSSLTAPVAYLSSFEKSWRGCQKWRSCHRLFGVDLRTGGVRRVASLPWTASLLPDKTGKYLAGDVYLLNARSRVVLVDLTTQPVRVHSSPLAAPEVGGQVIWLPGLRFLFLPWSDSGESARVLDLTLRTHSRFRWKAGGGALVGSNVFGVHYHNGALVSAKLPSGPAHIVQRLPGEPFVIVSASD